MIDLLAQLASIHRSVARDTNDDELVAVTLRRTYPTDRADLWEALTTPERLARWFMPITGDLRVSGKFQLQGNAGGEILACEPPRLLRTTFGDASSIITVTLAETGPEQTELTLDHRVPLAMAGSIAGALYVGPGWDGALLGLALHVDGWEGDPVEMASSPEVVELNHRSVLIWRDAVRDAGATEEETDAGYRAAMAQFAPHITP